MLYKLNIIQTNPTPLTDRLLSAVLLHTFLFMSIFNKALYMIMISMIFTT